MSINVKHMSSGALLALAAALAAPAGAADSQTKAPEVKVSYTDLNVDRPAGAARLYQRIRTAAAMVCGHDGQRDLKVQLRRKGCMDEATRRAVEDVNAPELTRHYIAHSGKSVSGPKLARRF